MSSSAGRRKINKTQNTTFKQIPKARFKGPKPWRRVLGFADYGFEIV
jgi:hypothetical protein